MSDTWKKQLACAIQCHRCNAAMGPSDPRILSVVDHQAICMSCKQIEEARDDYADVAKAAIGQCLIDTELQYGDPGGYCYHHFYPFTCEA